MASSPLRSKTKYHARSVSFPSSSLPLIPQLNEHIRRLGAPQEPSSSLPSISNRLNGLEDLYDCVDDLLLLPHTQQVFSQEYNKKSVDEALDGYIRLLDVCGTTKDVFSQVKKDVQELLSILRRKRDPNDLCRFSVTRKKVKNMIQKSLKDLKSKKNKSKFLPLDAVSCILKDVEAVTLSVFGSLLVYAAGTKSQTRRSSWSVVSKLLHHKNVGCRDEVKDQTNELETVEAALYSLISGKKMQVEDVQNQLVKMESRIQDLEEGLDRFFRHLIKTRVSLLNILNH